MRILLSNDDGVYARGIWALAGKLSRVGKVVIVAPDREQSAVGTAVTLRKPLRVQKISPLCPGVEAHAVEGTPSDSVIVGLGKLMDDKADLVVSGINHGSNLGEDVLISGTVGAAMAGYLRGFPAIAVSCERKWFLDENGEEEPQTLPRANEDFINGVSRFIAVLVQRMEKADLEGSLFLNVNVPSLPLAHIKGVKITRLARRSHVNTVEQAHDATEDYYMLIRQSINKQADPRTDIGAISQGYISITPLHLFFNDRFPTSTLERLSGGILEELR